MTDINASPAEAIDTSIARQQSIEHLYLRNFGFIRELCESDPTFSFDTTGNIGEALAEYLPNYGGPLTDEDFQTWLRGIVLPALSFAAIYRECGEYVRAAIRKVLLPCIDLGVTEDHFQDAEQATWIWAWEHLQELRAPNQRAKPKTRLYAKAKFAALSIRKTLLRAKERFRTVSLSRIGTDANVFESTGVVIEPLQREQDDPYARSETVGAKAA